jgi:hypothetical protein
VYISHLIASQATTSSGRKDSQRTKRQRTDAFGRDASGGDLATSATCCRGTVSESAASEHAAEDPKVPTGSDDGSRTSHGAPAAPLMQDGAVAMSAPSWASAAQRAPSGPAAPTALPDVAQPQVRDARTGARLHRLSTPSCKWHGGCRVTLHFRGTRRASLLSCGRVCRCCPRWLRPSWLETGACRL